jgi:hypothetical protein
MKLDASLGTEGGYLRNVGDTSRAAEALGSVGLWTSETKHDASLPLAIAASETERIGLGTSVARCLLPLPDGGRPDRVGRARLLGRPLYPRSWHPGVGPISRYHVCFRTTLGTDGSLVLGLVA